MEIDASAVKACAESFGSNLCGIASVDRFSDLPEISNPARILPGAKSVVVVARKFLFSTLESTSAIPYTIIRNQISHRIDEVTIRLAYYLEENGYSALPTGAIEPCNFNREISKSVGLVSLKNAARRAGLGVIGKNTLLITPEYGNMVWLGAVITTAELSPDAEIAENPCGDRCRLCIDACPAGALDGGLFMDQDACWNFAFGEEDGGEWRVKCFRCRQICPHAKGFTARDHR